MRADLRVGTVGGGAIVGDVAERGTPLPGFEWLPRSQSTIRLRKLSLVVGLVLSALSSTRAGAFGTIVGFGQNAEHERITRAALACAGGAPQPCFGPASIAALAGDRGAPGTVAMPDLSYLAFYNPAHCDGGDYLARPSYPHPKALAEAALRACREWMLTELDKAVLDSGRLVDRRDRLVGSADTSSCFRWFFTDQTDKCQVLRDMGLLLHTAQDFYAHTNWVDRPSPGAPISKSNPPGLGHTGPAPWISLRDSVDFPAGLISGCFVSIPESMFCNEPGGGGRVKHENLQKDEGPIGAVVGQGRTPRGRIEGNFQRAVVAAIADTREKWALLQDRLTSRYGSTRAKLMVCALADDDPRRDCSGVGGG